MPTDSNQFNFKPFGSNADNKYKPIEFGNPAVEIDPTDADAVNKIRGNAEWERGIEGNSVVTSEGIFGYSSGNIENAKFLALDLILSRYIYPRGIFAYSSTITYNLNSHCFDIATGIIYKSVADLHTGEALNDTDFWVDTGQTIASYITQITQNTEAIANLQGGKPITLAYNSATIIDYSAGTFQFDDGTGQGVLTAGSVDLATNGIGGLDTGSIQADTTYFLHGYQNDTTGAFGTAMSTSPTSSTISGWTRVARIRGAVLITNGSSQIIQGTWYKDGKFEYLSKISAFSGSTPMLNTPLTIATPLGIRTQALFSGDIRHSGAASYYYLKSPSADNVLSGVIGNVSLARSSVTPPFPIITNTASEIQHGRDASLGSASIALSLHGWIDNID